LGAIFFSIDLELVHVLQRALPLGVFVETGTFKGDTAHSVAPFFERVYTIELSDSLFPSAAARFEQLPHVSVIHGDSPNVLRQMHESLRGRAVLYWLDAHWCGPYTGGETRECPLLEELQAIASLNHRSVVLIDDARLFLSPPPPPHDPQQWPTLLQVVGQISKLGATHELWIINDVMLFVPAAARSAVIEYSRTRGIDLLTLAQAATRAGGFAADLRHRM
jgi:hypothetical protein